jgi:hypothetical protein
VNTTLQTCINELVRLNAQLLTAADDRTRFYTTLSEIERLCNYHKARISTRTVIDDSQVEDDEL